MHPPLVKRKTKKWKIAQLKAEMDKLYGMQQYLVIFRDRIGNGSEDTDLSDQILSSWGSDGVSIGMAYEGMNRVFDALEREILNLEQVIDSMAGELQDLQRETGDTTGVPEFWKTYKTPKYDPERRYNQV